MNLQAGDKAMLAAGYYGKHGKMGCRKVGIELITHTSEGIPVALVHFKTANEQPRWVYLVDLAPQPSL